MLEAAAGEPKVMQPVIERRACHLHPEIAHIGEVRQPHPAGLLHLALRRYPK